MALNIVKNVAESQVRNAVAGITRLGSSSDGINWENYNWPCCIRLVHFSLDELQGTLKRFVLCQYLNFIIIVIVQFINRIFKDILNKIVLSTIIQVSKYYPGINIFYSFLSITIVRPPS